MDGLSQEEMALRRRQGDAVLETLEYVLRQKGGERKLVGDFLIAWYAEGAEGHWEPGQQLFGRIRAGALNWTTPTEENQHIEVVVCDAEDGRFLPGLEVEVSLTDQEGREVGSKKHQFFWSPLLHHYGANWQIPREGAYTLRVKVAPPSFPRHHRRLGNRYQLGAEVIFTNVQLRPQRYQEPAA